MCARVLQRLLLLAAVFLQAGRAFADDNWPQWRGPLGTGVAADGDYPVKFSGEEGLAWKIELPGPGSSTPAVWGDSIFVTCTIGGEDGVVCYDFDGQEKWRETLGEARAGKHRNGSGSNPSPVTDGKHLVVYYKSGRVACLDLKGEELWQQNLQEKYAKDTLWWDLGTSPVLVPDKAIIAVMQAGESYIVALDLATGNEAWKRSRQFERPEEYDQAYTTPTVTEMGGRPILVVWGADNLDGYDARTGNPVWFSGAHPNFNPENKAMWRVIASHAIGKDIAVVPWGRGRFLTAVKVGDGHEDLLPSSVLWTKEGVAGDVPTPVVDGERVYSLTDVGKVTCLDLKTGEEHWSADLPRSRNKFYASPVLAGDKLYCVHEGGMAFVGRVGNKFELLAENDMGERVIATPVAVRGGLLIRGEKHLFRFEGEESSGSPAG
jgi:outer membrane protein assembly factor BamB